MLVQAASGLERMMYANQNGPLKDSTVAQISAFVYYEAAVLSRLTTNPQFKRAGNKTARLFKLNKISEDGLSFRVNYEFLPSRSMVPGPTSKRRHMFANKASIMEAGKPLVIRPKNAERLVFEIDGETVFMPKGQSVTIRRPGGSAATNQFTLAHSRFFSGNLVNSSIKNSGFQRIFNSSMSKALRVPSNIKKVQYSFSPNLIRSQADSALAASFGGVM